MADKVNKNPSDEEISAVTGKPNQAPPEIKGTAESANALHTSELYVHEEVHIPDAREVQSSVKKGLESAISAAMGAEVSVSPESVISIGDGEVTIVDAMNDTAPTVSSAPDTSGDVLQLDFEAIAVDESGKQIGTLEQAFGEAVATSVEVPKELVELEGEAVTLEDESDDAFEMVFDESGVLTIKHGEDKEEKKKTENLLSFDSDIINIITEENPFEKLSDDSKETSGNGKSDSSISIDDIEAFRERCAKAYEKKREKYLKDKRRTREDELSESDVVIHDEIVLTVKQEGEKLVKYDISVKEYLKHSNEAVKSFMSAVKAAKKSLDANYDEREAPMMIAEIIKIYGKILEIRCNNLENLVKVKAHSHIRKVRIALHEDINNYNEYVVMYSSLTGEQLTRMSTFLPENIADGEALAVVPVLSYKDSYVQQVPDENGEFKEDDHSKTIIAPMMTAEGLLGKYKPPRTKLGCAIYRTRAKRATRKLERALKLLGKMITEANRAERYYENDLKRLDLKFDGAERDSDEYRKRVFRINMKYGRALTSISTLKTRSAFAKTKIRLLIGKLTVEREKLTVAYKLLRETYRYGKPSQKKLAEEFFVGAMFSYNKCAELCSRVTGTEFPELPSALVEEVCRGEKEITFPLVAYKRELVETVGEKSIVIGTAIKTDVKPSDEAYYESAQMIFGKSGVIRDSKAFLDESAMVDRASAIAKVLVDGMRTMADAVSNETEFRAFFKRSKKVIKVFKRALRRNERAMSSAFDDNGVITALVENLRILTNLIEVRRIGVALCEIMDKKDRGRHESRALYRNIELYNGRAIDYMSIVGEQFTRISTMTASLLVDSADSIKVPTITYKDNYIEVFPKDPLDKTAFVNPVKRDAGVYTPLLMQHFRLTENRAIETTVINAPFVFDEVSDESPVVSWWETYLPWVAIPVGDLLVAFLVWLKIGIGQPIVAFFKRLFTAIDFWGLDESLLFARDSVKKSKDKNERRKQKFEIRLERLNEEHKARILALETVVHDTDRQTASYQRKLYKINAKYSRSIYKLKMKWMNGCHGKTDIRFLLERLVIDRERIVGINKKILKFRNYGRLTFFRNILNSYKKAFYKAVVTHNETAKNLSELIGTPFSEVASSVADDIIRYGNVVKFPQIVCCREVIETIDGVPRTVGDRWHGFGLYTGTSGSDAGPGGAPVMSVGAMGYSTDMGVPYLRADFSGMSMLGMTKGGVPLIGFANGGGVGTMSMRSGSDSPVMNDSVPLSGLPLVSYPGVEGQIIPFAGIPMMLKGSDDSPVLEAGLYEQSGPMLGAVNVGNPYSGVNTQTIDSKYVDAIEETEKRGTKVETSIDIASKMIEERFMRSLGARSMTTVDGARTWWKLLFSEINAFFMRRITRRHTFLKILLPEPAKRFKEDINARVNPNEERLLVSIVRLSVIIEMEAKRLYSAAKVGIRRSERIWSYWLLDDIQRYNDLVRRFNALRVDEGGEVEVQSIPEIASDTINALSTLRDGDEKTPAGVQKKRAAKRLTKPLNEWLDTLSLNIPDSIIHRLDERPPTPSKLYYRNRVMLDEDNTPFMTDHIEIPLSKFAKKSKIKKPTRFNMWRLKLAINKKAAAAKHRRDKNDLYYYRIRREKALNMKRYNNRLLRAIGYANDPAKYQKKMNKALRKYYETNFRIDYNMRYYQLFMRLLNVDIFVFFIVETILLIAMCLVMCFCPDSSIIWTMFYASLVWAVMPLAIWPIKIVCSIILGAVSVIRSLTKWAPLLIYGAKEIEESRNGIILNCFIAEQYKILARCEEFRRRKNSKPVRRKLIQEINEYNKSCDLYSDTLRIPINKIEITRLTEKLMAREPQPLTEFQNFLYAKELIEESDPYKVGEKLSDREFITLVNELNKKIDRLQLPENMEEADDLKLNNLAGKIRDLGAWISEEAKPTSHERYRFKRDLYRVIEELRLDGSISDVEADGFCKDAFRIVDYIGGKPRRKIVRVLARDNMVIDISDTKKSRTKKKARNNC